MRFRGEVAGVARSKCGLSFSLRYAGITVTPSDSGRPSPSSRSLMAAALASADPPGGARSPSSRHRPRPGPPPWPWFPFLALTRDPHHDFELGRWLVTAWRPALVNRAVREERGQIYSAPEVLEKTNRYNECTSRRSDGGLIICFDSDCDDCI